MVHSIISRGVCFNYCIRESMCSIACVYLYMYVDINK